MVEDKKDIDAASPEELATAENETPTNEADSSGNKATGVKAFLSYLNPISLFVHHKVWFLISLGALITLSAAGVAVWWFFLSAPSADLNEHEAHNYSEEYYALPDIKIRMRYDNNTLGYLVIGLTLKAPLNYPTEELKKIEPELVDTLHTYFASVTLDSFSNTNARGFTSGVALERLRHSILQRINTITAPKKIGNVLFRKLITQ